MTLPKTKILVFGFVMFLITVLFWGFLALFFKSTTLPHLTYFGIGWLLFLSLNLVFFVLVDNRNVIYLTYILGFISFFLFFHSGPKLTIGIYAISLFVFLILMVIGYELIRKEKQERLSLSLRKIWKRGLPLVILGISLIMAVVYYFNPLLNLEQQEMQIPPKVFRIIMAPFSGTIGKMLPFYDPNMTIDEIFTAGTMFGKGEAPSFESIPPELMEKVSGMDLESMDINQLLKDPQIGALLRQEMSKQTQQVSPSLLKQQRAELEKTLGITLDGNETFDVLLSKIVNDKLKEFVGPRAKEISIGIAVALFLVLRFVGKIFSFVVIIFARLFFYVLLLSKLITKETAMKEGEVVKV